ncbi:MAG TPA: hypothetical protein VGB26_01160 [Nitrospiria bacterium]
MTTLEFVPNEDRVSPDSSDFAILMLATTQAVDAYTFKDLDRMFKNSGFQRSEIFAVPQSQQHLVITCK